MNEVENQTIIEKFLKHKQEFSRSKREDGITKESLQRYRSALTLLSNNLNKPFKEATQQDILNHLSEYKQRTKNFRITLFREFYQWLFNLEDTDPLPDCIRKVKIRTIEIDEIKYREKIVTETEYNLLMDNCTKPMYKAIIEALWCFGSRKNGIRSLLVKDVTFDGVFTKIVIREDKTQPREVVYKGRCEHLLKWKESLCPLRDDPNAPLFVSRKNPGDFNEHYEQVCEDYIYDMLKRMCERSGLRQIKPHDFRHTCATRLLKDGVPTTHVCSQLGWKKNTAMVKVYDHNSVKDYQDYLMKKSQGNDVKPTYELLEKQKKDLEGKYQKQVSSLQDQMKEMRDDMEKLMRKIMIMEK